MILDRIILVILCLILKNIINNNNNIIEQVKYVDSMSSKRVHGLKTFYLIQKDRLNKLTQGVQLILLPLLISLLLRASPGIIHSFLPMYDALTMETCVFLSTM